MPLLSRRSIDPLTLISPSRDRGYPQKQSALSQNPRIRSRSEASLFRRVSTLFTVRRRTSSKSAGIEYIPPCPWAILSRISSDSTPHSSLEIRRPSGLGRRASLLGSSDSITNSEDFGRPFDGGDATPTGFASLPNLLGGAYNPHEVSHLPPPPRYAVLFALPDPIFRVVLEYLPRSDLSAVALVSHGFCSVARYVLYHALDIQDMAESSRQRLYNVLASKKELAALVVSFCWRISVPSSEVRQAFQNMYNLKSLTLASFVSILSLTPSFTFSLTHLTILDKKMTQSQLVALRSWLAMQPSLESLSFPHLAEYTSTEPVPGSDPSGCSSFSTLLPCLKSLHASAEIVAVLCSAINNPIQHLKLAVHATLYTGLRPGAVVRSLSGVRDMHIVFAPEVDKRTVEKFLGIAGSILTGENKPEAMKSLEVEVLWKDNDAAETLYGIVTSIISRFRGLESLKLTSPFRSVQALIPDPVSVSPCRRPGVPSRPSPLRTDTSTTSALTPTQPAALRGITSTIRKEFVVCGIEQSYAKTWTKHCPSLSDIQFDFSCSTTEAEVELCGVWFRRRAPSFPLTPLT